MEIYDYIYVDLEKAASLFSQLTGEVVEITESNGELVGDPGKKKNHHIKIIKNNAGSLKETIKPYHCFLTQLEDELLQNFHMANVNKGINLRNSTDRKLISEVMCLKVTGRCVIEDYERIKSISKVYPDLVSLLNKSLLSDVKDSPEYIAVVERIRELEEKTKSIKSKNQKERAIDEIKKLKMGLAQLTREDNHTDNVETWVLDGMNSWIETFLPDMKNLRVYPSIEDPTVHVFGHLKPDCLITSDFNSLHFTYGSKPSEEISMVGVVTSVPSDHEDNFDPLLEFKNDEIPADRSIEKTFRRIVSGFERFENMVRTARFPRVMVKPIMVYRKLKPNLALKATVAKKHS